MEVLKVEICNWDKYNPRKDLNNPSWFRMDCRFWQAPDIYPLSNDQKMILVALLCEATHRRGVAKINVGMFTKILGITEKVFEKTLNHLSAEQIVKVIRTDVAAPRTDAEQICSSNIDSPCSTRRTERDERDGTNEQLAPAKRSVSKSTGSLVWDAYAETYQNRYGAAPPRNAKTNSQCKQLVDRLGTEKALATVRWFVRSNNRWHVTKGHGLGVLLADCESISVQAETGKTITESDARKVDQNQANLDVFSEVARERGLLP